ncbi:PIN domain-containing protein [Anabaena azotica]|nr:PIN domain-containing protein [Anabaena azotica]
MAIAHGRDSFNIILNNYNPSLKIVIPDICFIEALSTFEKERQNRQEFNRELNIQYNKAFRDINSPNAQNLMQYLQQTIIFNNKILDDITFRLKQVIISLIDKAEIINMNSAILADLTEKTLIGSDSDSDSEKLLIQNDLMDNLILQCILNHAKSDTQGIKVFLSGNTKDFDKPKVQEALRNAGISKYFTRTQDFLGWLQSQNS